MGDIYHFKEYTNSLTQYPLHLSRAFLDSDSFKEHSHDFSEIVIITGGEGVHITENGSFPIRAGDVYVIHPGQSHGFRECIRLNMFNLSCGEDYLFRGEWGVLSGFHALFHLEPLYRKQHHFASRLHLRPDQREAVESDCLELEEELQQKRPGYQLAYEGLFRTLLVRLCRYYETNGEEGNDGDDLIKLGGALAVLEQRYTENLSLEDLAALSGYSPSHFSRLCEKVYGQPPLRYVQGQRISLATRLLRETRASVTEVAGLCGYDDPNYFSRLFKKRMDMTPRGYRDKDWNGYGQVRQGGVEQARRAEPPGRSSGKPGLKFESQI